MNRTIGKQNVPARPAQFGPAAALDTESILEAYRRWAGVYDTLFGGISSKARFRAVDLVNRLPGREVLEVGVGTGLALPHYHRDKSITGIDLSFEMLRKARQRKTRVGLPHVRALHEMDAEATSFPDHAFDIAVAMFVASVVPKSSPPAGGDAPGRATRRKYSADQSLCCLEGPQMVARTYYGTRLTRSRLASGFRHGRHLFARGSHPDRG